MGRGISFPSRLGSLGERRKLPQRGLGQSPGRKRILVHFELEKKNKSGDDDFDIFCHFYSASFSHIYKASCTRYAVLAVSKLKQALKLTILPVPLAVHIQV